MKILIIGENNFNSLEKIYKKNFKVLNCKIVNIHPFWAPKNFFLRKFKNFQEKYVYFLFCFIQNFFLKKKLTNDHFSYDLILVFNGYHLDRKTIECIKKKSAGTIANIQTDNIFLKKNILKKNLDYFDKIFVWSKVLQHKINKKYKIKKKKIYFLPFGFDQFLIKNKNYKNIKNQILFYGSWDKDRENSLKQLDSKIIKIYGNGWEKANKNFKKKYIIKNELVGAKLVKEVSESLICLNLFRPQAKNFINMRSFEVLGFNGRLVSEHSKEQYLFFKSFKNVIYFKNLSEISLIYQKMLNKKIRLIKTKKENKKKVINHNYLNRAKYILRNEKNNIN